MEDYRNEAWIFSYIVGPAIKNLCNRDLTEYYKMLMLEITSCKKVTSVSMIQNRINSFLGNEYDCEIYEASLLPNVDYNKFWAYRAMLIVESSFERMLPDTVQKSLFNDLNYNLDNFYVDLVMKKGSAQINVVDFLLEKKMSDIGLDLIKRLENHDFINIEKMCELYMGRLEEQLNLFKDLEHV